MAAAGTQQAETPSPVERIDPQTYDRDGVALVRGLIPPETMRAACDAWQRFYSGLSKSRLIEGPENLVQEELPREVRELYKEERLLDEVERLLGPDFGYCYARLAIKDRHFNKAFGAHQDFPYFRGFDDKVSVFVSLTHCDEDNGALGFVKRSHTLGHIGRGNIDMDLYPQFEMFRPELDPGDCVFMHFYTWHQSKEVPNREFPERALYQIFYAPSHRPEVVEVMRGVDRRPKDINYEPGMLEAQEDIDRRRWEGELAEARRGGTAKLAATGVLSAPWNDEGHCFIHPLDGATLGPGMTGLLFEDGVPLPRPVTDHGLIRREGEGRYSITDKWVYFSSSDGTSPLENGRTYSWVILR